MKSCWWQKSNVLILLSGFLGILITCLLLFYNVHLQKRGAIERGVASTWTMAGVAASETERIFYGIEQVYTGIRSFLEGEGGSLPPHDPKVRQMLDVWMEANPFLMDILIVDGLGRVKHWTGPADPPVVRDRDYIDAHFRDPTLDIFVGAPKLSRVHTGQWFFGVSRALRDSNGAIDSIYVAVIRLSHLQQRYTSIEVGPESSVVLLDYAGAIYTRVPDPGLYVGKKISRAEVLPAGQKGLRGVQKVSPLDGRERIWSMRPVPGFPLLAAASVTENEVFRVWRRDSQNLLLVAIVFSLGIAGMTFFLIGLQRRQDRTTLELERLASTDSLTGLTNRRQFMSLCRYEINRARRSKSPLSLIMVDLDHFKEVNDNYGHDAGDQALVAVAAILKQNCRISDTAARLGGEEFALLLPETDRAGAMISAENLRAEIESAEIRVGSHLIPLTVSAGVSPWRKEEDQIHPSLSRADSALYHAKWCGRNQVCSDVEVQNDVPRSS